MGKVEATFIFLVFSLLDFGNEVRKIHFCKRLLKKLLISRFKHVFGFIPNNTRAVYGVRSVGCVGLHTTNERLLWCKHNVLWAHILSYQCVLTRFRWQLWFGSSIGSCGALFWFPSIIASNPYISFQHLSIISTSLSLQLFKVVFTKLCVSDNWVHIESIIHSGVHRRVHLLLILQGVLKHAIH